MRSQRTIVRSVLWWGSRCDYVFLDLSQLNATEPVFVALELIIQQNPKMDC